MPLSEVENIWIKRACPSGRRAAKRYDSLADGWDECTVAHYLLAAVWLVWDMVYIPPVDAGDHKVLLTGSVPINPDGTFSYGNKTAPNAAHCAAVRRAHKNPFRTAAYRAQLAEIRKSLKAKKGPRK